MQSLIQFSVFLVNKPGVLSQVCRELGRAKVNIVALAMMDAVEHGVLRIIAEDADRARPVLRTLNIPLTETEVLSVPMANRPGALADVCERLSKAHIPISYTYCTSGAAGGKTLGIFKVPDIKKAMRVIGGHNIPTRDMLVKLRPSKGARKAAAALGGAVGGAAVRLRPKGAVKRTPVRRAPVRR